MTKTNRRKFLGRGAATAAAVGAVSAVPAAAQPGAGAKRVMDAKGGKSATAGGLFSPMVAYGNLLFVSGVGYHEAGDIKVHTTKVLDQIHQQLEAAGSSMNKVLKATVFLADGKDYAAMNEAFEGRFGNEPPVRTTVHAAWVPGNSLGEIDVIAYI